MSATIALAVPHCPWIPERAASMQRLREQLGVERGVGDTRPLVCASYREFTDKEPNAVWSEKLWTWLVETGADYCLVLQDDVEVAPNLWRALQAMLEAVPDQIIGLAAVLPIMAPLAVDGHRWVTSAEHLIGWAYCLPRTLLVEFLEWRSTHLKPGALEVLHEDDLLDCWCLATGRRVWHPIPTTVQHDTSLESSYANDGHQNRRSAVTWDTPLPGYGATDIERAIYWSLAHGQPPHLGLGYVDGNIARACLQWVKGFTEVDYAEAMRHDGRDVKRRLVLQSRIRQLDNPKVAKLMLATPTRGEVHPAYARSVWLLSRLQDIELEAPFELHQTTTQDADVVVRRSQFVRQFLESAATHLLFLDSDVEVSPAAIVGMLRTEKDFVATPYPMRDHIDFPKLERPLEGVLGEARAYRYALRFLNGATWDPKVEPDLTAQIELVGLGCALLSRNCLQQMVDHYAAELTFLDGEGPGGVPTVALFQLLLRDRKLQSEDRSFCMRWRDMGGDVWMYLGPGSPATHHGQHAYRGHLESFGLRRV